MRFFYPALTDVNLFLVLFLLLSWLGFFFGRMVIVQIIRSARGNSPLLHHVLIIGTGSPAQNVAEILQKQVTYDLERLMEGATLLKCSEFGTAIINNM